MEIATGENYIRDKLLGGSQEAYDRVRTALSIATLAIGSLAEQAQAAGISCFIAGTSVVTADGQKPIEDIQVGDYVWAWDEETDDVALKQVVETYINETTELTHVFVNGEEIIATPTHPFYCPTKGWTDAAHLRAGDILVLVNGEYVVVEKVQHELLESPVKVYNFQVEDYHTYYIASGVLVHNSCGMTNSDAKRAAEKLGYRKVSGVSSHGNAIFVNPKAPRALRYITADADVHSGGVWKAADSIAKLGSDTTRTGTYDEFLRWIGK